MGIREKLSALGRHTILLVDHDMMERAMMEDAKARGYDIVRMGSGREALYFISAKASSIAMIIVCRELPDMSGLDFLKMMKDRKLYTEEIPIIFAGVNLDHNTANAALGAGCVQALSLPLDIRTFQNIIVRMLTVKRQEYSLQELASQEIFEHVRKSRLLTLVLAEALEQGKWNPDDIGPFDVERETRMLLERLRAKTAKYSLSDEDIDMITYSSCLRNIGYAALAHSLLAKPGQLTVAEFEQIKSHTTTGAEILADASKSLRDDALNYAEEIARSHHEHWDGAGYPDGLKGDEIPISAQAVGLAGTYNALVHARSYRPAFDHDTAVRMILSGECGAFNPLLIECFREVAESFRSEPAVQDMEAPLRDMLKKVLAEHSADPTVDTRKEYFTMVEREEKRLRFYASLSHDCIFEYQADPPRISFSEHAMNKFGLPAIIDDPWHNTNLLQLISLGDLKEIDAQLRSLTLENERVRHDVELNFRGSREWNRIIAGPMLGSDGTYQGAVGVIINVENEHRMISRLEEEAAYDPLTKLRNRRNADAIVDQHLHLYTSESFCFCVLDCDDFKKINDQLGHASGDIYLMEIGMLLKSCAQRGDVVGRLGGDEFVWFFSYAKDPQPTLDRALALIQGQEVIEGGPLLSVSLGAATTEEAGRDTEALYRCADEALYEAKRSGKGTYRIYRKQN